MVCGQAGSRRYSGGSSINLEAPALLTPADGVAHTEVWGYPVSATGPAQKTFDVFNAFGGIVFAFSFRCAQGAARKGGGGWTEQQAAGQQQARLAFGPKTPTRALSLVLRAAASS